MTYISRRTRIVIPRWLDECDAELRYRINKKRSDGRLKANISCDDLRAWVNNNCIKHDYLVEMMSRGEFPDQSPVHIYGRFIPVPVLFELLQGIQQSKVESFGKETYNAEKENEKLSAFQKISDVKKKSNDGQFCLESNTSLLKSQCETYLLEKRLFESTNLLCRAVGKLEKIDNIVCIGSDESQNIRDKEIQEAFAASKAVCCCSTEEKPSELSSKSSLRRSRDSRGTELLRKISCLREKLKKIKESRKDIKRQIKSSQQKGARGSSSLQVTELYSRREQERINKLEKKLEKLIGERGKLLSEMCQALISWNNLKKMSKSNMSFRESKSSKCNEPGIKEEYGEIQEELRCSCGCTFTDPSDSDKMECSRSNSSERSCRLVDCDNTQQAENCCSPEYSKSYSVKRADICNDMDPEKLSSTESYHNDVDQMSIPNQPTNQKKSLYTRASPLKQYTTSDSRNQKQSNEKKNENTEYDKRKPKLRFVCPETGCDKTYLDNLAYYQKLSDKNPQAFAYNFDVKSLSTKSMPVKETKQGENVAEPLQGGRKIKSETTMKEIEKALRNYEQRLKTLDCLENKIETLKQKLSEANQLKRKLIKRKNEGDKLQVAEKEKTSKEMTKLCWENWELKRQIELLTAKFDMQSKKLEELKYHKNKLRQLEGEAEELKKELSEYQENYEDQRKCISKLENVVVSQKAEMEKLMNRIRKLSTMRESAPCVPYEEKKNVQRSRSYSPEVIKLKRTSNRPRTQVGPRKLSSEEEEAYSMTTGSLCCHCEDFGFHEIEKGNQMKDNERRCCYSPPIRRPGRCMN